MSCTPETCKHDVVLGYGYDRARCLVCLVWFDRENPNPKALPCRRCEGPTCMTGSSECRVCSVARDAVKRLAIILNRGRKTTGAKA